MPPSGQHYPLLQQPGEPRTYTDTIYVEPAACSCSFPTCHKVGRIKFLSIRNNTSCHKCKITGNYSFNPKCLYTWGQERKVLNDKVDRKMRLQLNLELEWSQIYFLNHLLLCFHGAYQRFLLSNSLLYHAKIKWLKKKNLSVIDRTPSCNQSFVFLT